MQCILITDYDDLTEDELESLKSQGVDTDDWDIMVFYPLEYCDLEKDTVEDYNEERNYYFYRDVEVFKPKSWEAKRIIEVGWESKWYTVNFQNQDWCLGVKHH